MGGMTLHRQDPTHAQVPIPPDGPPAPIPPVPTPTPVPDQPAPPIGEPTEPTTPPAGDPPAEPPVRMAARPAPPEIGGPEGPEPTRYGDWERKGRVSDF